MCSLLTSNVRITLASIAGKRGHLCRCDMPNRKWPNMSYPVFTCFHTCLYCYRGRGRQFEGLEAFMPVLFIAVLTLVKLYLHHS